MGGGWMDGWVDGCMYVRMYACMYTHILLSTEEKSFDLGSDGDGKVS